MVYTREFDETNQLLKLYREFLNCYPLNFDNYLMDVNLLQAIFTRYWKDVDRLKHYHPIEKKIGRRKIAGYLTYWISKLKPINVINYQLYSENYNTAIYVNECFAFYIVVSRIYSDPMNQVAKIRIMPNSTYIESFVYTLKYRPTTGDNLSLMYYLLEESAIKNTISNP